MEETNIVEIQRPKIDLSIVVDIPKIKPIEHNLGVVKENIQKLKKFYDSLLFTEDQVTEAESELTKLRSLVKTMETDRKEKVTKYKEPIDDYETTAKSIEKLLKDSIDSIKSKIDVFKKEQVELETKRFKDMINCTLNTFIEMYPNLKDKISEDNIIFDSRWFNKTYKDKQINEDIICQLEQLRSNLERKEKELAIISDMVDSLGNTNLVKEKYLTQYEYTNDLSIVMDSIKKDNEIKVVEPKKENIEHSHSIDPFAAMYDNSESVTFKGTKEQINELKSYAYTIGITEIN